MKTDAQLFDEAARKVATREGFVFCTVTGTRRSAPRDAGAKMLVASDGSITGTVGGGPLEGVVIYQAQRLLAAAAPSCAMHFALDAGGDSAATAPVEVPPDEELGMKCGGEVTVFLDVIPPASTPGERRLSAGPDRASWSQQQTTSPRRGTPGRNKEMHARQTESFDRRHPRARTCSQRWRRRRRHQLVQELGPGPDRQLPELEASLDQ